MRVLGMNIGEFTIIEKNDGESISINAVTDVKVKIIFTYRIKYVQESFHKNGNLWQSHVKAVKDGKVDSDVMLKKHNESYLLLKENKDSTLIHDNIRYTGSLLYFHEPAQVSSMYKERTGEKGNMKCTGGNTYVLTDEKGRITNEYEYKDGVLEWAKLKHPVANILMKRVL